MRLLLSRQARKDLAEIADFYDEISPATARKVQHDLDHTISLAMEFPDMHPRRARDGLRRAVTLKYKYSILYTVEPDALKVRAVYRYQNR